MYFATNCDSGRNRTYIVKAKGNPRRIKTHVKNSVIPEFRLHDS